MTYRLSPVAIQASTDSTGQADLYFKSPGTFNGITPDSSNGLFVQGIEVWCDVDEPGAMFTNLQVSDRDGVLPGPTQGLFANYPTLLQFISPSFSSVSGANYLSQGGYFVGTSRTIITPIAQNSSGMSSQFLPSGLYLSGTYVSPSGVSGRIIRANFSLVMSLPSIL